MAIPGFQDLMLPFLIIVGDEKEHTLSEVIDELASEFNLSEEERDELLPSGRQARFDNRVGWTRTHLLKAGLIESTGWGKFRITQRGLGVLAENPVRIDLKYLNQFPEFQEFRSRSQQIEKLSEDETDESPKELLEEQYERLRDALVQDLIAKVKERPAGFLENLSVNLLMAMGYGISLEHVSRETSHKSRDGGIDGVIYEDKLGLERIYIQAKRYDDNVVGVEKVRDFVGALEDKRARKGVFITTSSFSQDARSYAERIGKVVLIDGQRLARLMIEHNVGVVVKDTYVIKDVDENFFRDY
jgi:restriction system protein